ncbi:MAG: transporter substrate-binding domain-containing protein [Bauldia sp.]|nr:transporter substrate-binding domain-containing protein [Bauldia sp.]MCW5717614.1 transporter substrate-binding domain-containing protein [Bauldia sp.]MCW5929950.1 transporter substrate-binding domain-containing protein [Chitinophagaceae bacterium]
MFLRRGTAAAALAACMIAGAALAQPYPEDVPDDLARPTRVIVGNEIVFCVNRTSMLAEFERELVAEIAGALLLNFRIVEIDPYLPTHPYDFRSTLQDGVVYLFLAHQCDAMMGLTAASAYPDWLAPSPVYLTTNTVLATRTPIASMAELPATARIGARILSLSAGALTTYLRTLPGGGWTHVLYPTNESVLDRLADASVDAALVWGPAVLAYATDHPDAPPTYVLEELGFPIGPTQFVAGLRPREQFFNASLAEAIQSLVDQGIIAELARDHGLLR